MLHPRGPRDDLPLKVPAFTTKLLCERSTSLRIGAGILKGTSGDFALDAQALNVTRPEELPGSYHSIAERGGNICHRVAPVFATNEPSLILYTVSLPVPFFL